MYFPDGVYLQARSADKSLVAPFGQQVALENVQMGGRFRQPLTSSTWNSSLKDSTVDYPDRDCPSAENSDSSEEDDAVSDIIGYEEQFGTALEHDPDMLENLVSR
jgi:hypothetical protein